MCCFSVASPIGWIGRLVAAVTPPVHVSATNIFARMIAPGVQALAYGMNLDAKRPVAMILPLPIAPGSGEDAVTFVDLAKFPTMFTRLAHLFDGAVPAQAKGGLRFSLPRQKLVVHRVGSFIASYVPARADFSRLDARFRMPSALFDAVPHYADYGFAVFQLEPGKTTVHPMALTFPTRDASKLFFPTVHVHDGRWKPTATFDHALYYQTQRCTDVVTDILPFSMFEGDAVGWSKPNERYEGLVEPEHAMLRRQLQKRLPNVDTWISV